MTKLTVLVTGATAGFGQAIAKRYLAEGHKVVAAGRRADRLEALKKSLPADQQARLHTEILFMAFHDYHKTMKLHLGELSTSAFN